MLLHRTRATMAAFVTSLQAYVMTEVMEAEWAGFAQHLDSTPNMDELVGGRDEQCWSQTGILGSCCGPAPSWVEHVDRLA